MVNQVQFHPLYFRQDIYDYCKQNGIFLQAWKPLAKGELAEDAGLSKMAATYNKTVAQVLLRWQLQLGNGIIPKSIKEERIRQNAELFDFALTQDEMDYIRTLDKGTSISNPPEGVLLD